jgi:hypothetical protein
MGPHDRAKLQAKLDLAKAKVLRRTPKDPRQFRMASLCRKAVTFRCGFFATNRSPFFAPLHPGSAVGSAAPAKDLRDACVDSCLWYCHCCTPSAGEATRDGQGDF